MTKESRIYIVGSLRGSTRARIFLDYIASSPQYTFFFKDSHYLKIQSKNIFKKLFLAPFQLIDKCNSIVHLIISDTIFILPMGKIPFYQLKLASFLNKKIVYEFYISKYDTYVYDKKRVDKKSKKAIKLLKEDQNLVDLSTHLVFLNKSEQNYYLDVIGRSAKNLQTSNIPLATEVKEKALLPFANGFKKEITLCWWGSFIPLHGVDKIIEAAKYLNEIGLDFKLYLFGTSDKKAEPYQKKLNEFSLNKKVIIDNTKSFADKSLEKFLLENCDLAFGNFGDSGKAKVVMVNKAVEAISMQIPVISQPTEALKEYFTHAQNIYFCGSSSKEIAQSILEITKNKDDLLKCAINAYELYKMNFSKEVYIKSINTILNSDKGKS